MPNFRRINSPVALATCGMFLVPEPFGACLLLAAAIWWLWRKTGCPCRSLLSSFWDVVRRRLRLPGVDSLGGVFGKKSPAIGHRRQQFGLREGGLRLRNHVHGQTFAAFGKHPNGP
jgi:hypothetical protein